VQIRIDTNTQPIFAGDDITIAIGFDTWEAVSTLGYGVSISMPVQRTLATFVPFWKGPEFPWHVDAVGQQVVFQVTAYPIAHSAFSDPVTILPVAPELVAPVENEVLHAGSPYTFRWNQIPPSPEHYRLRFSTDGAQTFPELGGDFAGNVEEVTRTVPPTASDQGRVRLEGLWTGFDPVFNHPIDVKTTDEILLHVGTPPLWQIGEDGTVNWTVVGDVDHYKVDLTRDGGQSWAPLASNVPGTQHHLTVGVDPPASTHCRVRVEAFGGGHTTTATSGVFHIGGRPPHHGGHGPRD
jgi:hypothetical protein